MYIALDRVCGHATHGQQHDARKRIAQGIVSRARSGRTTVGASTDAGERALVRMEIELASAAAHSIKTGTYVKRVIRD
jgi:hypothetical protein